MEKQEAAGIIKVMLGETLGMPPKQLDEDAFIVEDLGATSMEVVQVFVYFQELGIVLTDRLDLYESISIGQIADMVAEISQGCGADAIAAAPVTTTAPVAESQGARLQ
jgi:acyl carrier protein